ncbi:MAG: LysM peptidoglycan-binding domain-containing protein, partial [Chloroflexi bacterium]|nr:LysM peptidoglycan-binding domain-containing protein [Chloroflexota bacterium]
MKRLLAIACIATFILLGFASRPARAFGETYIVQPGDTLLTIATRYGISVNDLAAANGLNNGFWVYAGQQLIIPTSSPFLEPPPFAGVANLATEPRFVSFAPPPGALASGDYYPAPPGDIFWDDPTPPAESFSPYPALPAPPDWRFHDYAAPPPWRPYPAPQPVFYDPAPAPYPTWPNLANERWIDVDLTYQTLIAYEGQRPVFRARVSSGLPQYPTVVGTFSIYVKYEVADMSGGAGDDAYFLPGVPY